MDIFLLSINMSVPGAFMQGDQEERVHMWLNGILAEMLIECNPAQYEKYVIYENKQKILYVELMKALYGTLHAALIFWHDLTHKLVNASEAKYAQFG